MREIFKRHQDLTQERPQLDHSSKWWAAKTIEEAHEQQLEVVETPSAAELELILLEGADVVLSWVGLMQSLGVSADTAILALHRKLDIIEEKYPKTLFDGTNGHPYESNYLTARPDKALREMQAKSIHDEEVAVFRRNGTFPIDKQ